MSDDAPEAPGEDRASFAARLEQLATVTQLTLATILRVVEARQGGTLTGEQLASLGKVREDVARAVAAIDEWKSKGEPQRPGQDVDLDALRQRLGTILGTIGAVGASGGRLPGAAAPPDDDEPSGGEPN
jgi:hypothetical protein